MSSNTKLALKMTGAITLFLITTISYNSFACDPMDDPDTYQACKQRAAAAEKESEDNEKAAAAKDDPCVGGDFRMSKATSLASSKFADSFVKACADALAHRSCNAFSSMGCDITQFQ